MTSVRRPPRRYEYVDSGPAIYVDSFATIRREADLRNVPADAEKLAVRMIHGSGQVDNFAFPEFPAQSFLDLLGVARIIVQLGEGIQRFDLRCRSIRRGGFGAHYA